MPRSLKPASLLSSVSTGTASGGLWTAKPVRGFFKTLERQSVLETLFKEMVGISGPRILCSQTPDERRDVLVSEAGNTAVFAGTASLDWLLRHHLFKPALASQTRKAWAHLGGSVALISFIFSLMWAMPFLRNFVTARASGKTGFSGIVSDKHHSNTTTDNHHEKIRSYLHHIVTIAGLGIGGTILGILVGRFGKGNMPALLSRAQNKFGLANGEFRDLARMKALVYWGLPAYGGWIQASREAMELKEQLLKFAGFITGFWAAPRVVGMMFNRKLLEEFEPLWKGQNALTSTERLKFARYDRLQELESKLAGKVSNAPELAAKALKTLNQRAITELFISVLILGTIPLLMNLHMRPRRLQKTDGNKPRNTGFQHYPSPQPMPAPVVFSYPPPVRIPVSGWQSPVTVNLKPQVASPSPVTMPSGMQLYPGIPYPVQTLPPIAAHNPFDSPILYTGGRSGF